MLLFQSEFQASAKKALPLFPFAFGRGKVSNFHGELVASEEFCMVERFASCLSSCLDIRTLRKLHACIFTHRLGDSIYLGSKLLNCYANVGALSDSRRVFNKIINENVSLWNSAIVGYFRAGYFKQVLMLYIKLKSRRISIDSSAITFSLKSCIELDNIKFGRGMQVDAFKAGLNGDKFIGSSLIGLYSKCGCIDDAQRAFEDILEKDLVACTSMITGYAQLADDRAWKAFNIARDVQRDGLDANRVMLVGLLQAAGWLGALAEGRSIHCYALRRGVGHSDEVLETSLVDMYARCGAGVVAASVLRQMERQSVAAWNAVIAGLLYCGKISEALSHFYHMVHKGSIAPDSITLANVLSACSDLYHTQQVTSIHGYIIRREIPLDLVLTTSLINLYLRSNKTKNVMEFFYKLTTRDVVSYNVIISGCLQNGTIDDGIKLFTEMVGSGIRPNSITMLSLLSGFADSRNIRTGRMIHGLVFRYYLQSDLDVSNQIIHMYANCGYIGIARITFDSMIEKDLFSWTVMMTGYVNTGHADEALLLLGMMQGTGEKPNSATLITVLQALSQLGCSRLVREVHGYVYRVQMGRDIATNNSIITSYAKCGRLDIAEVVFGNMVERGVTSWNTMVAAYGMHGYSKEVLGLFYQMQQEKLQPDEATVASVLSACSHAGLVEEGCNVFHSMRSYAIVPQEEHYSCMVDLLSRAGRLEEAYELVSRSPMKDKTSAFSALLAACRIHRSTKLGEIIGRQLLEMEPQNSCTYALVSSIYAQSGKWSDVAELRSLAKDKGLKKIPGFSLIEADKHACNI